MYISHRVLNWFVFAPVRCGTALPVSKSNFTLAVRAVLCQSESELLGENICACVCVAVGAKWVENGWFVGFAGAKRVIWLATKLAAIHLANCTRFASSSLDVRPNWLSFRFRSFAIDWLSIA